MSNYIGSDSDNFVMSNGLTDVFLNVLILSGSQLATSDNEKQLIVWLAERDQSKRGSGTVGFDVGEMPWDPHSFADSKAFMLNVILFAKQQAGWETLGYRPDKEMLFPMLDKFYDMISAFTVNNIMPDVLNEWVGSKEEDDPVLCGFPKCEKHDALLCCFGCQICNN